MVTTRSLRAPVAMDPSRLDIVAEHDCDAMMTQDDDELAGGVPSRAAPSRAEHTMEEEIDAEDAEPAASSGEELIPEGLGDACALVLEPWENPCLAILDSGCTKTMRGASWAKRFEEELKKLDLEWESRDHRQSFKGVGGKIVSQTVKVYPIAIQGVQGDLYSSEAPGNLPLLLSRPWMENQGTVIDIGQGTVSFKSIGVEDLPLLRTSKGHLAINILDYPLDAIPDNQTAGPARRSTAAPPADDGHNDLTEEEIAEIMEAYNEYEVPEGWDPDSWAEHLDFIEIMRQDVENWEDGEMDGNVSEDVNYFEEVLLNEPALTKRATNKKGKRLQAMVTALEGDDWRARRVLSGKAVTSKRPPFGKTWMKQLFAGQMGLTLLCVYAGMMVGTPLDYSSSNWDASTSQGRRHVNNDLQKEDPYLLVVTQPCGPWGAWSRFNIARGGVAAETVFEKREEGRKVLTTVNRVIRDRVKAKRHVLVEQPRDSEWLYQPEMSDVRRLLEEGVLVKISADGCQLGYLDSDTGLPYCKPTCLYTTMFTAESVFANCKCPRTHYHQHLEGSNSFGRRTAQASVWPEKLNNMVLETLLQQAMVEATVQDGIHESFPAEVPSTPAQGRRKRSRMSVLTGTSGAPPVYLRPDLQFEPIMDEDERTLHELIEGEDNPFDDSSERAAQVSKFDPVLNNNERDRRRQWLEVPADVRKILRDLHVQFGHPTNTTMMRILRRLHARPDVIRAAQFLGCDSCGDSINRRRPKPTKLPSKYVFNHHLQLDTFYAKDVRNVLYSFLNILDEATGFQVVTALGQATGPPATRVVLQHFLASWSSWAGLPQSIQVDMGKEYMAAFATYMKQWGVEQEVMPLEAPWKGGRCERAGATWKEIFNRAVKEMQLDGFDDVLMATGVITQCRNSFPRSSGYAPNQWVLGTPQVRLPGSLLVPSERERLEVLEAAENPDSAMARSLGIREAARVAQVRLDTDGRVRRALPRDSKSP